MYVWPAPVFVAAVLLLLPAIGFAFCGERLIARGDRLSPPIRIAAPALAAVPYYLAARATLQFQWLFVALYAALPVALVTLLWHARTHDPGQLGNWRDYVVLAVLGLVVEFRLL